MEICSFSNFIVSGENKILPPETWTPRVLSARLTSRHGLLMERTFFLEKLEQAFA